MNNAPSSVSNLPALPAYQLEKITMLANNYAKKFSIPLAIRFVEVNNGKIAWVKDDSLQNASHWLKQKEVFINTPTFQQRIYATTGEMLDADSLLQVVLHEVGHLYENAELKHWGEKLTSSSDFSSSFQHSLTPFVAKHFDALEGATLAQKREKLFYQQEWPNYHSFENVVRDIYVNHKSVGLQEGIFALRGTLENAYLKRAFPWEDWTKANEQGQVKPRFAQFSHGMLRNAMIPHNPVKLIPEVERKLKRWNDPDFAQRKGQSKSIIQMASDENIPFPVRLPYLFFLYEEMKKFRDNDLQNPPPFPSLFPSSQPQNGNSDQEKQSGKSDQEKQSGKSDQQEQNGKSDQEKQEGKSDQEKQSHSKWSENSDQENQEGDSDQQEQGHSEQSEESNQEKQSHSEWNEESDQEKQNHSEWNEKSDQENQEGKSDQQNQSHSEWSEESDQEKQGHSKWSEESNQQNQNENSQGTSAITPQKPLTPEQLKEREKAAKTMPHALEDALNADTLQQLEKALADAIAHQETEAKKSPEQKQREQRLRNTSYADLEHTDSQEREKKLKLLERTDALLQEINAKYADVIQDLQENVFDKIISKRERKTQENHGPVNMEQGNHTLHPRGAMRLHNDQVMGKDLTKTLARGKNVARKDIEKLAKGFRLTIVCDGSWSMEWTKNQLQKLNTLLMLQTLKNLQDELDIAPDLDPDKQTDIYSQAMIFHDEHLQEFKAPSNNLTDEELMRAMEVLDTVDGGTPLHLALQKIKSDFDALDPDLQQKIKDREEIAVALILSDGESD